MHASSPARLWLLMHVTHRRPGSAGTYVRRAATRQLLAPLHHEYVSCSVVAPPTVFACVPAPSVLQRLHQLLDRLSMTVGCRTMQWRHSINILRLLSAPLLQRLHRLHRPPAVVPKCRGVSTNILRLDVSTTLYQQRTPPFVPARRAHQRRLSITMPLVHVRARCQQPPDFSHINTPCCGMQFRRLLNPPGLAVHLCAAPNKPEAPRSSHGSGHTPTPGRATCRACAQGHCCTNVHRCADALRAACRADSDPHIHRSERASAPSPPRMRGALGRSLVGISGAAKRGLVHRALSLTRHATPCGDSKVRGCHGARLVQARIHM